MKKVVLISTAIAMSGAVVPAFGADLAYRPPVRSAPAFVQCDPIYNWTGYYIGGHLGGAFSGNNAFSDPFARNNSSGRFLAGLQLGADYQFAPNWLVGVEGQYSWLSGKLGATFPNDIAYTNDQSGIGSVTGRFGYTWGPGLVYVKGGYAYSSNKERVTAGGVPVGFEFTGDHRNGWTVGVGMEYLLWQNLSATIEYQHYNFGKATFVAPDIGGVTTDDNVVRLGLNYRFSLGGPL